METTTILVNKDDRGVGTITLNRAELHNAFDDVLIREMTETLQVFDKDDSVRLVVVRSTGKSFSAGADLNWMKRMASYSWQQNYQDSLGLATLMQTLASMNKPTFAVVQGSAFGGGVGLVACCDIALAAETASFCLSEVKLGLIPSVISPYVVAAIGERAARRYFVTAEKFTADTALRLGLVHDLHAADQLDAEADKLIAALLANGPRAVQEAKRLIERVANKPIDEELVRSTAQKIADMRASAEGREGVTAFLEKRPPNWNVKDSTELDS
ncbi:enoyl-CoA hydratase/isomerase family protein [Permianibacter sp. IMCC34836]|uniref:enoyl-CoA hydratase/isomerase family protein n=1 Tax=Permianibacter fluminis TaxID=2738515 RepID=UPI0015575A8C|nr:enoyl-CoA hydratase/isomerase family protein [Permianibacter fluminis]NQD37877.1 enoyl-CoA hydratase/isomerase family protein [Permianibacter fluminis]